MNDASLRVSVSGLPDTRIAQLTRELAFDLSRAGIDARPVEMSPTPGERGEPITLGVLALALVTTGTVKAAIDCFKSYFSRERTLSMTLTCADGKQVEVTARNVDTSAVREALEAAVSAKSG
jgi:hypothetical protein